MTGLLTDWVNSWLISCPIDRSACHLAVRLFSWLNETQYRGEIHAIIQEHIFCLFATWLGQRGCRLPHFGLAAWLDDRPQRPLAWVAFLSTAWQNRHSPWQSERMSKGSMSGWMKIRRKHFPLITSECGRVTRSIINQIKDKLPCLQTDCNEWHLAGWVNFLLVPMAIIQPNSRMTVCVVQSLTAFLASCLTVLTDLLAFWLAGRPHWKVSAGRLTEWLVACPAGRLTLWPQWLSAGQNRIVFFFSSFFFFGSSEWVRLQLNPFTSGDLWAKFGDCNLGRLNSSPPNNRFEPAELCVFELAMQPART